MEVGPSLDGGVVVLVGCRAVELGGPVGEHDGLVGARDVDGRTRSRSGCPPAGARMPASSWPGMVRRLLGQQPAGVEGGGHGVVGAGEHGLVERVGCTGRRCRCRAGARGRRRAGRSGALVNRRADAQEDRRAATMRPPGHQRHLQRARVAIDRWGSTAWRSKASRVRRWARVISSVMPSKLSHRPDGDERRLHGVGGLEDQGQTRPPGRSGPPVTVPTTLASRSVIQRWTARSRGPACSDGRRRPARPRR